MKSQIVLEDFVFNQSFQLLNGLLPSAKPIWGRMNAQQMIEHLTLAVNVSNGINQLELLTPLSKLEKTKNLLLMGDRAMPKLFHNPALPSDPIPCQNKTIKESISALHTSLQLFKNLFQIDPQKTQLHNIFGELNYNEWLWFHYKHFHHHFAQFQLIPYVENFN